MDFHARASVVRNVRPCEIEASRGEGAVIWVWAERGRR